MTISLTALEGYVWASAALASRTAADPITIESALAIRIVFPCVSLVPGGNGILPETQSATTALRATLRNVRLVC